MCLTFMDERPRGAVVVGARSTAWLARINVRVRHLIISFPDQPRRGKVARFCREHGISRAEFYKVR